MGKTKTTDAKIRIMYKILIIALTLGTFSCSRSNKEILTETHNMLTSEKAISYCADQITVEGKEVRDTIFTKSKCSFIKLNNDSLCGFKYFIENKLIHPRFKIPMTLTYFYDGQSHTWNVDSELKKDRKLTVNKEKLETKIKNDTYGHMPYVINILTSKGFTLNHKRDTLLDNSPCILLKAVSDKGVFNELYIDKNTSFPKLLRIVENSEYPLIKEFNYTQFEFSDSFNEPIFTSLEKIKEKKGLGIGDKIPDWELETIDGKRLSLSAFKGKTTIVFLSAIYCPWCQEAIPIINNIFDKSTANNDIDCIVFYPDDERKKLKEYSKKKDIKYPITFIPTKDYKERYTMRMKIKYGFPTTLILNGKNEIVWIKTGYSADLEDVIEKAIINSAHKKL